jgi:hypothetical protein
MGAIINPLIEAGLTLEYLHEFPSTVYQALSLLERGEDGWWRLKKGHDLVPLLFSLKARK